MIYKEKYKNRQLSSSGFNSLKEREEKINSRKNNLKLQLDKLNSNNLLNDKEKINIFNELKYLNDNIEIENYYDLYKNLNTSKNILSF